MAKTTIRLIWLWPLWAALGYLLLGWVCDSTSAFPWRSIWYFHTLWSLLFVISLQVMLRRKPGRVGFLFLGWSAVKIIMAGSFALWASWRGIDNPMRFAAGFMLLYVWFTFYEWWLNHSAINR